MSREHNLPMERGQTYGGGDASAVTAGGYAKIVGQEFEVYDGMTPGTDHGTNMPVVLKVVQNLADASLSTGRGVQLSTAGDFGQHAMSYGATQGGQGILPIDDAYGDSYSIINNDAFFVVKEGPCHIKSSTGSMTTINVGDPVTWTAQGRIQVAAADGDDNVVGISQSYITATQTNADVLVIVGTGNLA